MIVNSFWQGPVSPIINACHQSFLDQGYTFHLYSYENLKDTIPGVVLRDASEILSADKRIYHRKTGSVSLFTNHFRYELLEKRLGLWVDSDILCLKPIDEEEYIFGYENKKMINGAVLKIPSGSTLLKCLLAIFEHKFVPPWYKYEQKVDVRLQYTTNPEFGLGDLNWGVTGPYAITYYATKLGLDKLAKPVDHFYPFGFGDLENGKKDRFDIEHFCVPNDFFSRLTKNTKTIHLYWNKVNAQKYEKNSLLGLVESGEWKQWIS